MVKVSHALNLLATRQLNSNAFESSAKAKVHEYKFMYFKSIAIVQSCKFQCYGICACKLIVKNQERNLQDVYILFA